MNSLVNFIFESGISLTLLSLVYLVFLRRETFFRMNRIFLLASVAFSLVLPFVKFRIFDAQPTLLAEVTVTPYRNLLEAVTVYGRDFSGSVEKMVLSTDLFAFVYTTGMAFFLLRFLVRLFQIGNLIRKNRVRIVNGVKFIKLGLEISPFSFLGYVFVGTSSEEKEGFDKIMAHEFEHIKQGHSVDVILMEILTIFQWFNPAVWMLRRAIRENHEYLADRAVLTKGGSQGDYKQLVINQMIGNQLVIASHFNYSIIKNRIKMMSKIRSPKIAITKISFGILVAAAMIMAFACEQKQTSSVKDQKSDNIVITSTIQKDGKIKVEGTPENLEKYVALFAKSSEFEIIKDSIGNVFLTEKKKTETSSESHDDVFFVVEQMPEYPGGEMALRKFISSNVTYPENAKKKGIQGKVFISFIVSKEGAVRGAKVIRGVDPELDREALRVVNLMQEWKPGVQKGVPVNVSYTIPINFLLQ